MRTSTIFAGLFLINVAIYTSLLIAEPTCYFVSAVVGGLTGMVLAIYQNGHPIK